jgi:PTS system cellobiose-specific IIA component
MNENNPLINVAMQMILHAGDARININDAISAGSTYDFKKADDLMRQAQDNLNLSHKAQTEVIQNEMAGENYEPCILFTHAQDTLMTISSEMMFGKQMIELYRKIQSLEAENK